MHNRAFVARFVYLVFVLALVGGAAGDVQVASAQGGTEWTSPVNLSSSGTATNPQAVVDSNGTIHALWVDRIDGYKYSQSQDGITWSPPQTIQTPFLPKGPAPVLLAGPNNVIHIFWINADSEFFYGRATPNTFNTPARWNTVRLNSSAANFDAMVDPSGTLHLAFIRNRSNESEVSGVYYRQLIAGGVTWSAPVLIYPSEYFRLSTPTDTYLRVAATNQTSQTKIYISWDNRPLRRLFLARSEDAGQTWLAAQQLKGPEDTGGLNTPFNATVWSNGIRLLSIWQVGQPGADRCSVFSQLSEDEGANWGAVETLISGGTPCPEGIRIVPAADGQIVVLMQTYPDPVLLAWNGSKWSDPIALTRLPALSNPETFAAIVFGCRQDLLIGSKLFVVGCDEAAGGDIWFLSRTLPPLNDWFSASEVWSQPRVLEIPGQAALELHSITDGSGGTYTVWAEAPTSEYGSKSLIRLARLSGEQWSSPVAIISDLEGVPQDLTLYLDSQNRLMLTWVNSATGDLLFSWANLEQAGVASGWANVVILPSPSQLSKSPDIVVDATGRIIIAFVVPLNEDRGVYVVQSSDNGLTWSPYMQAFDAALSKWELLASPRIALTGNGDLHLLVTRQAVLKDQPLGLYYLRSQDGGLTWSEPQLVSEGEISWSILIGYGQNQLQRIWQVNDGLEIENLAQESADGGLSWGEIMNVTGVSSTAWPVTLAANRAGQLYFVQLSQKYSTPVPSQAGLTIDCWKWSGTRWTPDGNCRLTLDQNAAEVSLTAGLDTNNYLVIQTAVERADSNGQIKHEIVSVGRLVEANELVNPSVLPMLPTPDFATPELQVAVSALPTTVVVGMGLNETPNQPSALMKNLIGMGLIVLILILAVWRILSSASKRKSS